VSVVTEYLRKLAVDYARHGDWTFDERECVGKNLIFMLERMEKLEKVREAAENVEPFVRDALEMMRRSASVFRKELEGKYLALAISLEETK